MMMKTYPCTECEEPITKVNNEKLGELRYKHVKDETVSSHPPTRGVAQPLYLCSTCKQPVEIDNKMVYKTGLFCPTVKCPQFARVEWVELNHTRMRNA